MSEEIPGYDYGDESLPEAPYDEEDLEKLQAAVMFDEENEGALRETGEVLEPRIDEISTSGTTSSARTTISSTTSPTARATPTRSTSNGCASTPRHLQPPYDQEWLNYQ